MAETKFGHFVILFKPREIKLGICGSLRQLQWLRGFDVYKLDSLDE